MLDYLPQSLLLHEPGGYGQRRAEQVTAHIDKSRTAVVPVAYAPAISLLAEPASFMALVPANAALDAATKIVHRYELEMSKVRNRLPLLLGLVFFDRRQPLFSALDAGRRLLKDHSAPVKCIVTYSCAHSRQNGSAPPAHLAHPHFEQWQELGAYPKR